MIMIIMEMRMTVVVNDVVMLMTIVMLDGLMVVIMMIITMVMMKLLSFALVLYKAACHP